MREYGFDDGHDDERRQRIEEAQYILTRLGFDVRRRNFRSAATLVVLAGLDYKRPWSEATNRDLGINPLLLLVNASFCSEPYAVGNRESFRKFTIHQFIDAGLVEHNVAMPGRAVNDSRNDYRLADESIELIRQYGTPGFTDALERYMELRPRIIERNRAAREVERIPITLPDGSEVTLSPGGQNVLMKEIIEEFCPVFTPGGTVLYIGDADTKLGVFDAETLSNLGVEPDLHGKFPDIIVYLEQKNWLFLIEAVTSHGPIDNYRLNKLREIFADSSADLVFVNCFPDRTTLKTHLGNLAWECEIWMSSEPDHLIHMNGDRFLGPH